jgi:hypothetical protein
VVAFSGDRLVEVGGTTLVDTDGHAHAAYGVDRLTFAVVRPDGYLGLMTHDGADVDRYLTLTQGQGSTIRA